MATIRAYTTIEQSRKLAEILPLESADMKYICVDICKGLKYMPEPRFIKNIPDHADEYDVSAWSLAALLGVLPKYEIYNNGETIQLDVNPEALATEGDEVLLDLVVNMIIHLHELNLL